MVDFVSNVVFKGLDKINVVVNGLKNTISYTEDLNQSLDETKQAFSKLSGATPLGTFSRFSDRINDINKAFDDLGGSATKVMSNIKVVMQDNIKIFLTFMGKMMPFIPIILAIGAAIFTLKRIWIQNIGGMQNKFFELTGRIKDLWARFMISFDKSLRTLGPLFQVVFDTIFNTLEPIVDTFEFLINMFNKMDKSQKIVVGAIIAITAAMWALNSVPILMLIGGLIFIFSKLPKPIKVAAIAIGILTAAFWALSANPVGLIIAGIGLAIIGLIYVVKKGIEWFKKLDKSGKVFTFLRKNILLMLGPIGWVIKGLQVMFDLLEKFNVFGKISDFFSGDKEVNAGQKIDRNAPIKTSSVIQSGGSRNVINDNRSTTIHSAGEISKQNAPGIAEAVGGQLDKYREV